MFGITALLGAAGAAAAGGSAIANATKGGGPSAPTVDPSKAQTSGYYRSPEQRAAAVKAATDAKTSFDNAQIPIDDTLSKILGVTPGKSMPQSVVANALAQKKQQAEQELQAFLAKAGINSPEQEASVQVALNSSPQYMALKQQITDIKTKGDPIILSSMKGQQAVADAQKASQPTYTEQRYDEAMGHSNDAFGQAGLYDARKADLIDQTKYDQSYNAARTDLTSQEAIAKARREDDPSRQMLIELSQGQGPAADAARAQLQEGLNKSNNQAMSMANSARGGAGALALGGRTALMQAALNNQENSNQAASLRAQMAMSGIKGLSDQNIAFGNQDLGYAGEWNKFGTSNMSNKAGFASTDAENKIKQTIANDAAASKARDQANQWWTNGVGMPQQDVQNYINTVGAQTGATTAGAAKQNADTNQTQAIIKDAAGAATGAGDTIQKLFPSTPATTPTPVGPTPAASSTPAPTTTPTTTVKTLKNPWDEDPAP